MKHLKVFENFTWDQITSEIFDIYTILELCKYGKEPKKDIIRIFQDRLEINGIKSKEEKSFGKSIVTLFGDYTMDHLSSIFPTYNLSEVYDYNADDGMPQCNLKIKVVREESKDVTDNLKSNSMDLQYKEDKGLFIMIFDWDTTINNDPNVKRREKNLIRIVRSKNK